MEYKIIKFDAQTAQIVVQWDGYTPHTIDLPIAEDGSLPTGTELVQWIQGFAPTYNEERKVKIAKGLKNASEVAALVTPLPDVIPSLEDLAKDARERRNILLSRSDWTDLPNAPLTAEQKAVWLTYRQELRDITTQSGFPSIVIWPVSP